MGNGTHVELKEHVEVILREREKQQQAHFQAIEEKLKRQVFWVSFIIGIISGIIGSVIGLLTK